MSSALCLIICVTYTTGIRRYREDLLDYYRHVGVRLGGGGGGGGEGVGVLGFRATPIPGLESDVRLHPSLLPSTLH